MHSWELHKLFSIFYLSQEKKQEEKMYTISVDTCEISILDYWLLSKPPTNIINNMFPKKSKVELLYSFFCISSYDFYLLLHEVFKFPFFMSLSNER